MTRLRPQARPGEGEPASVKTRQSPGYGAQSVKLKDFLAVRRSARQDPMQRRQMLRAATAWFGGDDAPCSERGEPALALRSSCWLVDVHNATSPPSGRQGEAQQAPRTARHA